MPAQQRPLVQVAGNPGCHPGYGDCDMSSAHVQIDLYDVIAAGSVNEALQKWCGKSDHTSCGVVGPSFSTSGPGSGWSVQHDEDDFALRAMVEGAVYYLDTTTGRLIEAESAEDAEWGEDGVHRDMGGGLFRVGDWSAESAVEIVCPDADDAIESPAALAEMARSVIDYHHAASDCAAWRKLIAEIRDTAEALENLDLSDFPVEQE